MNADRAAARDTVDVAIVGGGLSGLALGFGLRRRGTSVRVLDAAGRPGGNIRSDFVETDGGRWLLERGPNSFGELSAPLMDLARAAGLERRVVRATDAGSRRWLYRAGRLREVPSSPVAFLFSSILPLRGRMRILREPFVAPLPEGSAEETLAAFCDRRLGRAAREKLLTPVVSGIYAGDPTRLGAESAFPRMVALEREHGSLIRAAMKGSGPPKRGTLVSFRDGLEELPRALSRALGASHADRARAERLERVGADWRVTWEGGDVRAARLVLATPAWAAAELLRPLAPEAAVLLAGIHHPPMAVVHVGFRAEQVTRLPPGFGFLVPRDEGLRILGGIASSRLFPGRAPPGHELLTVFCGGRLDPSAVALDDGALADTVLADLGRAVGVEGRPELLEITRWERAIPQYEVGHRERLARVEAALTDLPGLDLVGNWKGGIAMPDCARAANELCERICPDGASEE